MNKLLYITNSMKESYGGAVINRRNFNLLHDIYKDDLFVYEFEYTNNESPIAKIKNRLSGYYLGITPQHVKEVLQIIESQSIGIVFISNSLFSCFAAQIKKRFPGITILSFFHNVEYIYAKEEYKVKKSIKYLLHSWLSYTCEKKMIHYVDGIIALNQRDAQELKRIYRRGADLLLPTSLEDQRGDEDHVKRVPEASLKLLFVGSNFFANTHGISWFIDQVMPFLKDVDLYIVGKGMEFEQVRWKREHVYVIGAVDVLKEWYMRADVVVSPIFWGSGMKTKTAEALMYGKPVLGTKETFEGYDIEPSEIGALCNTVQEFVNAIVEIQRDGTWIEKRGIKARQKYESLYDYKMSLNKLNVFMRKFEIK